MESETSRTPSCLTRCKNPSKKPLFQSLPFVWSPPVVRSTANLNLTEEELSCPSQKKILRVAIIGRPNAGKSTLINKILDLNVCGVSYKTHTTRKPLEAAFTQRDTQIIFVDTPGLVTLKEYDRFNLSKEFLQWKKQVLDEADIIGVVHDVSIPKKIFSLHINLVQNLDELPESKPLFLVLNKIDLVIDNDALTAAMDACFGPKNLERPDKLKKPTHLNRFSRIFFTSAIKDKGVDEVANYLLEQAKPGKWLFKSGQVFDIPLNEVIVDLLRAQLMNILPDEIPYKCTYEVEYLKENHLGEFLCVSLINCVYKRHVHLITSGKKGSLRSISRNLESDLYKILGRVFKIRLVVQLKNK